MEHSPSGYAEHATPKQEQEKRVDRVSTREEYTQFFDAFDRAIDGIFHKLPSEILATHPETNPIAQTVFIQKKISEFRKLNERLFAIGRATEAQFANATELKGINHVIATEINPLSLACSLQGEMRGLIAMRNNPSPFHKDPLESNEVAKKLEDQFFVYADQQLTRDSLHILTEYFSNTPPASNVLGKRGRAHALLADVVWQLNKQHASGQNLHISPKELIDAFAKQSDQLKALDPNWYENILATLAGFSLEKEEPGITALLEKEIPETVSFEGFGSICTYYEHITSEARSTKMYTQENESENPPATPLGQRLVGRLEKIACTLLETIGLPGEKLVEAWRISGKHRDALACLRKNMETVDAIEKEVPGATATLQKEFGIKNFARCSPSVWIKQYQERNNIEKPYGILTLPASDWNGAFNSGHTRDLVDSAEKQLDGTALLRVIECENKIDLLRRFIDLKNRYQKPPGGHALSFVIVGGHGAPDSIHVGGERKQRERWNPSSDEPPPLDQEPNPFQEEDADIELLRPTDFRGPGVQRLKTFMREDAPIVLLSCSTGKEGGIGQIMAMTYDTDLQAPNKPAYQEKWKFTSTPEGKVTIETDFFGKTADTSITNTYKKGQFSSRPTFERSQRRIPEPDFSEEPPPLPDDEPPPLDE